jgi:N-acetylmuramoyl-L-alanine amidase
MRVENHLLVDDPRIQPYVPAPRGWIKSIKIRPEFVTEHYTATINLADAFASRYFAHIYIDELGLIYQKVPLDCWAAHAGLSEWGGRRDLNMYSHGIEHINYGWVYKDWKGRFGREWYDVNGNKHWTYVPSERVIDFPHRLEKSKRYFLNYTEQLIESSRDVNTCLYNHYHYVDLVGHEDICAKIDPGPAYPLAEMKSLFYGDERDSLFMVSRSWGGSQVGLGGVSLKWFAADCAPSKIWCPAGTVVKKLEWCGRWVKVIRTGDGKTGFIRECYLRRILGE